MRLCLHGRAEHTGEKMKIKKLADFLDRYLKNAEISDDSQNGLQVGDTEARVHGIAYGVDACLELFEKAASDGNDFIIVHHGLLWGKAFRLTGYNYKRFKTLFNGGLALYGVHLPLDLNAEVGHNIEIARKLSLKNIKGFGNYHGQTIGFMGEWPRGMSTAQAEKKLKSLFKAGCYMKLSGKNIRKVGVISGGGADLITDAVKEGIDLFVTGEAKHYIYHYAKENDMDLFFGGHYCTEREGLLKLKELIEDKFGIRGRFYEIPTGL